MHPTRFPELNQVLRTLVSWIQDTLPDAFVGFYLQGSFALGDFDDHSDVDFVVLVRDELEPSPNRFYQGFILRNYCRMLHARGRGYPGSKREGAEWAKSAFKSSWSPLIDRAWATRPDPARQAREPADDEDFKQTLAFVELA